MEKINTYLVVIENHYQSIFTFNNETDVTDNKIIENHLFKSDINIDLNQGLTKALKLQIEWAVKQYFENDKEDYYKQVECGGTLLHKPVNYKIKKIEKIYTGLLGN